jgi:hypothetical protein
MSNLETPPITCAIESVNAWFNPFYIQSCAYTTTAAFLL